MSDSNVQVRLRRLPVGVPSAADFVLEETAIPEPGPGQFLARTQYLSLDPYVRALLSGRHFLGTPQAGDLMPSRAVAEITASHNPDWSVGETVVLEAGLQHYCTSDGTDVHRARTATAPVSTALGVLGMPGLTAYAGLTQISELKPGETILVSAASGPVGCMVGQLARIMGARPIGIAGSAEKCRWAVEEAGFEDCINYKTEVLSQRITALRPEGVDVYFDNAGGDVLNAVIKHHLARNARIILCGLIAQYNLADPPPGPNLGPLMGARARILPLIVYDFEHLRDEFEQRAAIWYAEGRIAFLEDISKGIQSAPAQFAKLMRGENFGKTLVKVQG
jgi:NADPH-dependent curcumin reductase CurA